jgi:hypothetical protein
MKLLGKMKSAGIALPEELIEQLAADAKSVPRCDKSTYGRSLIIFALRIMREMGLKPKDVSDECQDADDFHDSTFTPEMRESIRLYRERYGLSEIEARIAMLRDYAGIVIPKLGLDAGSDLVSPADAEMMAAYMNKNGFSLIEALRELIHRHLVLQKNCSYELKIRDGNEQKQSESLDALSKAS